MKNRYNELIDQTFEFPQNGFDLKGDYLRFNGIELKELIDTYGTPLKVHYLPKIGQQIAKARQLFAQAFQTHDYKGNYYYCYCTKASHFSFILDEVTKHNVQVETSSAFDMDLLQKLFEKGKINRTTIVVCNGYKTRRYLERIVAYQKDGFKNVIPVLDNMEELSFYQENHLKESFKIGIRVATDEEPNFQFYTSRLGIRPSEVLNFYKKEIKNDQRIHLKMLHFFVDTGIKDSIYFWNEIKKVIKLYCDLKKLCPGLKAINVGGGLPIQHSLGFDYDYEYMIQQIVELIRDACEEEGIEHPDIFTEFGSFTIGESGATIFSVIGQKQQNDAELWYMVDNSLMNTLPDTWGIDQRFIILPINKWNNEYCRVNVGGITCDNSDYYNAEAHISQLYLPKFRRDAKEPLYIGFFHTGAYQDALSGYGGIKHCLIPSPKRILIDKDKDGNIQHWEYNQEQDAESMLRILGY